jgi:uncharacterized protein YndB with AHSA1/START domain/ribosomal protein S18 acetylase RimI-like enzyme/DNA-binding transcriptional ArsR family regulator
MRSRGGNGPTRRRDTVARIFAGLANDNRRALLDALFMENGQALLKLCANLNMSRQAASKHLALLERAELVVAIWQGREKLHYLNPVPLQAVYDRWIRKFEGKGLEAPARSRTRSEQVGNRGFLYQSIIAATPGQVWRALTTPALTPHYWFGRSVQSDWKAGSEVRILTPEGRTEVTGNVLEAEENRRLSYTWGSGTSTGTTTVVFEIVPMGPLVRLLITHDIDKQGSDAERAANGWTFILNGLKTYLETGKPLPSIPWRKQPMREDIRVVPITEDMVQSYHQAVDLVAREGRYLARTAAPPLEDARSFTRENIRQGHAHFVALDGERVVGWCDIVPSKREAFSHCGTLGMGLLKEYRGQGLGTRLLRASLEKARENGLERVELEVFGTNEAAIKLYEQEGFKTEGRKVRAARLAGTYLDVVLMARPLFKEGNPP